MSVKEKKEDFEELTFITLGTKLWKGMMEFRQFMFKNVYLGDILNVERTKSKIITI